MDRNIPHVLDIFVSSPGERRRMLREREEFSRQLKDQRKNPGSDSAVCLCSSSDEDERNISKYFDYLNDDTDENISNSKKKKITKSVPEKKIHQEETEEQKPSTKEVIEKESCKQELEKDIKQIERHLSMKKTIRKKMMRDLQQAFVEDPKEFQQDPECIPPERKNNINIHNLTISKRRMSKSEHSFLDMLKENELKDRKTSRANGDTKSQKNFHKRNVRSKNNENDSGNDSPTRESANNNNNTNKQTKANFNSNKDEKKTTFWQRLTGKGKTKR